jgi:hypothetical protein
MYLSVYLYMCVVFISKILCPNNIFVIWTHFRTQIQHSCINTVHLYFFLFIFFPFTSTTQISLLLHLNNINGHFTPSLSSHYAPSIVVAPIYLRPTATGFIFSERSFTFSPKFILVLFIFYLFVIWTLGCDIVLFVVLVRRCLFYTFNVLLVHIKVGFNVFFLYNYSINNLDINIANSEMYIFRSLFNQKIVSTLFLSLLKIFFPLSHFLFN